MGWPIFLMKGVVIVGFVLLGAQFIADTWMYYLQLFRGSGSSGVQEEKLS
jgi:hypothetical protein